MVTDKAKQWLIDHGFATITPRHSMTGKRHNIVCLSCNEVLYRCNIDHNAMSDHHKTPTTIDSYCTTCFDKKRYV